MLGPELLAITTSSFIAASTGGVQCTAGATPKVIVQAKTKDVRYDFTQTKDQLKQRQIDTVSPYSHQTETHVGGLMSGEIEIKSNVKLAWKTYPLKKQNCLWYDEVNITMEIDPTVYVAKEFSKNSCEYNEVLHHELKHIKVDREVVKKYKKVMHQYIDSAVSKVGVYGPVQTGQTPKARKKMSAYVEAAIGKVTEAMYKERKERQQAIDSLEEYERIAQACD